MNLLLNIINKLGFEVNEEKEQIIDVQNREIGTLSGHDGLITYSFCNGKKITLDKANNQVVIHVSDNLDIIYKMNSVFEECNGEKNQFDCVHIILDMHLSNDKSCQLDHYFMQYSPSGTIYEPRLCHYNFEYGEKSIEFSRTAHNPDNIYLTYENDTQLCATSLDEELYNVEGIKYATDSYFLTPLLCSSLIEYDEAKEIEELICLGRSIIDDSLTELINAFLAYDFSKDGNIEYDKIKTFGSLLNQK